MRIEVPQLPPAESSPNDRSFWVRKYEAARQYHQDVFYCCVDARNRAYFNKISCPFIRVRLDLTFIFSEHRRRDPDNLLARFKPGLDAIKDAGLILDDDTKHLEIGEVNVAVDPTRAPLTIIELKEVE